MRFSVVTATYNRAHTLGSVYESLFAQTFRDFEWVIVDDGSTDRTSELVASWKADFPLRYFWKPNGGQHTAENLGVAKAAGEFVLFFDSDDRCVPTTLERFDYHWRQIPDPAHFANLSCLCITPSGSLVGDPYPADCVDAYTFKEQLRFRNCERWGINRTDVLREFPFPEGERYLPRGVVWNRISRKYAARFFNEPLRIYEIHSDSINSHIRKLQLSSPRGTLMFYRELVLAPAPLSQRLRAAVNYCRLTLHLAVHRFREYFVRSAKRNDGLIVG